MNPAAAAAVKTMGPRRQSAAEVGSVEFRGGFGREGSGVPRVRRNSAGAHVVRKDGGFISATRSPIAARRFCQSKLSTPLQASLTPCGGTEAGDLDVRCSPGRRGSTPEWMGKPLSSFERHICMRHNFCNEQEGFYRPLLKLIE